MNAAGYIPHSVLVAMYARMRGENRNVDGYTLTKGVPSEVIWAKSRHGGATVAHRVKFQIAATEDKPVFGKPARRVTFTKWRCGGQSVDPRGVVRVIGDGGERCYPCNKPEKS